ncbi:A/G-specific adenine glycosylase [Flavicella sediminum]|uniref:A/G-specific adenine glycosylase n=1 Tax=Flavicella sediminum TaxID=2585141 RepID=UPI0011248D4E|nr:A/G-specific adenine glycosylase [Flavicella sediminum]
MEFCNRLELWYLGNKRDLPWRKNKEAYQVWLSEIILQQTRVAQGMSYYFKFLEAFPTVNDLANAPEEEVLKLWQGLGYYSRARNLHFSAKYIVSDLKGVFPKSYKELLALKGVGDYTASAVASICYNEEVAVVDGNVYRVLSRCFGISTAINSSKGIKQFKELAQELLPAKTPGNYNQALMDFGSLQCKPANPLCETCPLNDICIAYASNKITELPFKEKKIKIRNRYFNFVVLNSADGKTVLEQRIGKGIWENLFQFPLIETNSEIEANELIENSEYLSLTKGSNLSLKLYNPKVWVHKLSHQHLFVKFWVVNGDFQNEELICWKTVHKFAVPRIIHKFLEEFYSNHEKKEESLLES